MIQSALFQPLLVQMGASLIGLSAGQGVRMFASNLTEAVQAGVSDPLLVEPLRPLNTLLTGTPASEIEPGQLSEALGRTITNLQSIVGPFEGNLVMQLGYLHRQWSRLTAPTSEAGALQRSVQRLGEAPPSLEPAGAAQAPQKLGMSPGNETLLVVDDEPMVCTALGRILQRGFGYQEILSAGNGQEALEILEAREGKIAAVITDTDMPVMGGTELVRALRTFYPNMPVIMISGHGLGGLSGSDIDREFLQRVPHFAFFAKPFQNNALAWMLRYLIDSGN